MRVPRIAYFPDSFHEVNGVAHTSRNFAAYAERHGLPFLCVRASAGAHTPSRVAAQAGELRTLDLRRSPISVRMEKDLQFDPLFWRHAEEIVAAAAAFQPDMIHITGPSELGIFGAYFAWKHRRAPGRQLAHQSARVRRAAPGRGLAACCRPRRRRGWRLAWRPAALAHRHALLQAGRCAVCAQPGTVRHAASAAPASPVT